MFTDPKIVFKWLWMIMRISACYRPGNLRGTWNTELCRFLAKSKFRYKTPLRTPYKPLVEIMKIK